MLLFVVVVWWFGVRVLLFDCCLDCLCINSVGIALLGCLHVGLIFDCCVVSCVTLNVAFWRLRCY